MTFTPDSYTPEEALSVAEELSPEMGAMSICELGPERIASFILAIQTVMTSDCKCDACHILRSVMEGM